MQTTPDRLHPCLLLAERGDKTSCYYYQRIILETEAEMGNVIFKQVIEHYFKHRENNGEHLNMPKSQEGQVMI